MGGASLENKNQLKELTNAIQEDVDHWDPLPGTRAALAVLTDDQMKIWAPTFKEQGWRLILRWRNPNSGNVCNLLSNSKKTTVPKPFDW